MKPWFRWNETDAEDGKIVVPYTFHANFPWREEVNAAISEMNDDLGCIKIVHVPEEQVSMNGAPFTFGIVVAFEDVTGSGCYSAIGIAPGFIGRSPVNSITEFNVPSVWQVLSLGGITQSRCRGWQKSTIKHEFMHVMGVHHEHNRPGRERFLNVDLDATDVDHNFALMTMGSDTEWNTWASFTELLLQ